MNSGSDVLKRQFVTMRTIWPDCIDPSDFGHLEKTRYGLDQTWARAEQLVSNSVEFGKYLGIVSAKTSVSQLREGKKKKKTAGLPLPSQCENTRRVHLSPSCRPFRPQLLLICLLRSSMATKQKPIASPLWLQGPSFLDAFLDISQVRSTNGGPKHLQLTAKFSKAQYTAHTDGVLWAGSQIPHGILEMKKRERH